MINLPNSMGLGWGQTRDPLVKKFNHLRNEFDFWKSHGHARIQEFSSGGVQVSLTKKSSDNVFFLFFLVLSLFYRSLEWSISKKSIIFQGSRGGPTFSRGGSNFFQGGGGGPIAYSL